MPYKVKGKLLIRQLLRENLGSVDNAYVLYHGTSSNNLENIKNKPNNLFLTADESAAIYYAAKGGEDYFLAKEIEFENEYSITPDEYFDTQENGELPMFKALYPKNAFPIVIEFKIPPALIKDIKAFYGYKGGELLVNPKFITKITKIDWNDLDY
jgi:hypothetical protein